MFNLPPAFFSNAFHTFQEEQVMPTVRFVAGMSAVTLLGVWTTLAAAQEAALPAQPADSRQEPPATAIQPIDARILDGLVFIDPGRFPGTNLLALYDPRPQAPAKMSEFWIGIDGVAPDETLRAQLSLPQNQGVVVNHVIEGSPAEKAGIKPHDLLLTANNQPLASTDDLAKVIAEKKGAPFALLLIRGGGKVTVEVAAERRPASQTGETCPAVSRATDEEFIKAIWQDLMGKPPEEAQVAEFAADKAADKRAKLANRLLRNAAVAKKSCSACHQLDPMHDGQPGNAVFNYLRRGASNYAPFEFVVPDLQALLFHQPPPVGTDGDDVFVVPDGQALLFHPPPQVKRWTWNPPAAPRVKLPDDVAITISRRGNEPAKISVSRGDKQWECTEEDYHSKLPEELRSLVRSMLSGGSFPTLDWNDAAWAQPVFKGPSRIVEQWQRSIALPRQKRKPAAKESAEQEIKRRLEEISSELEGLKKKLDK
jgi:membrane-associated protease RseP (regulator of RpoE activity)